MAGQSNHDPSKQAEGFPEGVTVDLVNTPHETASLRERLAANACKAAYALALLKPYGFDRVVMQVIASMGQDDD